jgi:hypothetical protein
MDEIQKLLDRGCTVVIFRNGLKSYTSAIVDANSEVSIAEQIDEMDDFAVTHTDDFTPSKSLTRLSEKMLKTGAYSDWPNGEEEST